MPIRSAPALAAAAAAIDDPLVGQVVDGRYRVMELIGSGGMGSVYLAEHVLVRRKVALKTLHTMLSVRAEAVSRFHREAVAAASVGNPHIVDVLDMGQLDGKTYYIVMEHLQGPNLAQAIAKDGWLSMTRSLDIAMQMCEGLQAVHQAGIVHRDLKPENLVLLSRGTQSEFVKLLDFGICKVLNAELGPGESLTKTGVAIGTPQFMAPEQVSAAIDVDARVDVYASGAILFCMLAGAPPFDAPAIPQLFMSICNERPPLLRTIRPAIPAVIHNIVQRALAKSPSDRYASAAALQQALEKALPAAAEADARERRQFRRSGLLSASGIKAVARPVRAAVTAPTLLATEEQQISRSVRSLRVRSLCLALLTTSLLLGLISALVYALLPEDTAKSPAQHFVQPEAAGSSEGSDAVLESSTLAPEAPSIADDKPPLAAPKRAVRPRKPRLEPPAVVPAETKLPAVEASSPTTTPRAAAQSGELPALHERELLEVFPEARPDTTQGR